MSDPTFGSVLVIAFDPRRKHPAGFFEKPWNVVSGAVADVHDQNITANDSRLVSLPSHDRTNERSISMKSSTPNSPLA